MRFLIKVLGYRNFYFIGGIKLIEWGFGVFSGYIVIMGDEFFEKEIKIDESRVKKGRWEEIKKMMERDGFLMVLLG